MLKILTSDKAHPSLPLFIFPSSFNFWWPLGIVFAIGKEGKEIWDWFLAMGESLIVKFLPMALR